jgi:hypothetical protein
MRTLASRGMPARGSVQDRIACEMIRRDRRRALTEHTYVGRILASSLNLPEKLYQLWTSLLSLEIHQDNYDPMVVKDKESALKVLLDNKKEKEEGNQRMFQRLAKLTADDGDIRPATAEDLERLKRRLRAQRLRASMKKAP